MAHAALARTKINTELTQAASARLMSWTLR